MTHVRRRTSSAPRPRHDVAGPSINSDLFEAAVSGEADLGGADVAAHSSTIEEQPRLDRWPVSVQLTQTKRVTPQWILGDSAPSSGPALDAITATSNRLRMTLMPVIALRARWLAESMHSLCDL